MPEDGAEDAPRELFSAAFEKEREAASQLFTEFGIEPTRSVLYRSAASLALRYECYDEAERMIGAGLAGIPPWEIAEDLRSVWDELTFRRHLLSKGLGVSADKFQMCIVGKAVPNPGYQTVHTHQQVLLTSFLLELALVAICCSVRTQKHQTQQQEPQCDGKETT